jgi:class 3 adenylate cyclase
MSNEASPADDAQSALERRLATILSADVAGYSRMMGENEEATVQALRAHRVVFDALLKQHHGRIFNTAGDSILAEFPSAVEAVRCATEIQSALQTRNEHLPPGQKMLFRMGINVGDVVVQDGDLLGDGVNVASRIQTVAQPGGICISGSVYDQIQNKLSLQFRAMGNQNFKNIGQPIRTFTITHGEAGTLPDAFHGRNVRTIGFIAAGLLAASALAAAGYGLYRDYEAKRIEQAALTAQLATEKRTVEEARRIADEQSRRAAEAETKADRERLIAEGATREATLQAQVQSAEGARRRAEAERKLLDDERQRAAKEKRDANLGVEGARKKRDVVAVASAARSAIGAGSSSLGTAVGTKGFDGSYNGQLCNFPANPSKRLCWSVPLTVRNGVADGTWIYRMIGKPAHAHATISQGGAVKLMLDGWNVKEVTPLTGVMSGRLADDRIDVDGRWSNNVRVDGHWTRTP